MMYAIHIKTIYAMSIASTSVISPLLYDSAVTLPESLTKPTPPSAINPVPLFFDFHPVPTMPITTCTTYHVHDRNLTCLAEYIKQVSKCGTVRPSNTPCVLKPDNIGIVFIVLGYIIEDFVNTLFGGVFHPLLDLALCPLFVGLSKSQGGTKFGHVDDHFIVIIN